MLSGMPFSSVLPFAAGIGLKPQHYAEILSEMPDSIYRKPAWLEVHPQNYFCAGGPPHRWLTEIAQHFPLSFHSVGLSLGSADGHDRAELDALETLCARYEPASVSEHLSWSGSADDKLPDLLPIPYTQIALDHFVKEIDIVQNRLKRSILIENPSRYLELAISDMDEVDFLHQLCRATGCGLLLDINNVEVSCTNLGIDPCGYIDSIDPKLVGEIHLAGHSVEHHESGSLLIDDHGSAVTNRTWELFERFMARAGPKPVLIEWDSDVPEFAILMNEADKATRIMDAKTGFLGNDLDHVAA